MNIVRIDRSNVSSILYDFFNNQVLQWVYYNNNIVKIFSDILYSKFASMTSSRCVQTTLHRQDFFKHLIKALRDRYLSTVSLLQWQHRQDLFRHLLQWVCFNDIVKVFSNITSKFYATDNTHSESATRGTYMKERVESIFIDWNTSLKKRNHHTWYKR